MYKTKTNGMLVSHWEDKRGSLGIIGDSRRDFTKLRLITNNGVTEKFLLL